MADSLMMMVPIVCVVSCLVLSCLVCMQSDEQMAALPEGQRTPLEMERVWCGWTCFAALLAGAKNTFFCPV